MPAALSAPDVARKLPPFPVSRRARSRDALARERQLEEERTDIHHDEGDSDDRVDLLRSLST